MRSCSRTLRSCASVLSGPAFGPARKFLRRAPTNRSTAASARSAVTHAVGSGGLVRAARRTARKRRRSDHDACRRPSAVWTNGGIIAFGDTADCFEGTAFGALIVIDWHGIRVKNSTADIAQHSACRALPVFVPGKFGGEPARHGRHEVRATLDAESSGRTHAAPACAESRGSPRLSPARRIFWQFLASDHSVVFGEQYPHHTAPPAHRQPVRIIATPSRDE